MTSLLDRIDAVQVNVTSMISERDEVYCKEEQRKFKNFISFADDYFSFLDAHSFDADGFHLDYEFRSVEQMKSSMRKQIDKATETFISHVVWHFQSAYNVTLDSSSIKKKYDQTVTYQDIVREIVEQLGGMSFAEKGVQEIKKKARDLFRNYHNNVRVSVKKSKLVSDSGVFYWQESWSKNGEYRPNDYGCSQQHVLFTALSHFEAGYTEPSFGFNYLCRPEERSDWFDKKAFSHLNKVKSVKFFKNGKLEVEFASPDLAKQFANEYLDANV